MKGANSAANATIHSVGAITALIRQNLVDSFPFFWVRGEVTDLSIAASNHIYFALRDSEALLQCVWFAGQRKRREGSPVFDPLTGEVYETPPPPLEKMLHNGLELVCAGSLNVYPRGGRYQLIIEHAEPAGFGMAALLLEQRKARYEAAGYFKEERKRRLPFNPERIALITSPHGAAIHDFLKLASIRGLSAKIQLFPVTVQGKGAAQGMAEAIAEANRQNKAQVIVLVRGGGSREDLSEFNEEVLIEAIYASRIPVLTGIGHEVDFSLADLTADKRAATPSHAAQLLWPLRSDLWQNLDELTLALNGRLAGIIEKFSIALNQNHKNLNMLSPTGKLEAMTLRHEKGAANLERNMNALRERKAWRFKLAKSKMDALSLVVKMDSLGDSLKKLENTLVMIIQGRLDRLEHRFLPVQDKLRHIMRGFFQSKFQREDDLAARLRLVNPYAPLKRGYAFCQIGDKILRSVKECKAGDELTATLCDGELLLRVLVVKPQPSACEDQGRNENA